MAKVHLINPTDRDGFGISYCGMVTRLHDKAGFVGGGRVEGVWDVEEWVKIPESKQCAKCVKKARRLGKEKT